MAHEGTIRQRVGSSGTVFICQVEVGRDPVTNKRRYRTATAKTRREANTLLYELLKEVEGDVGRICAVYGDNEVGPASCPGGTGVRQVPGGLKTKTRPILADALRLPVGACQCHTYAIAKLQKPAGDPSLSFRVTWRFLDFDEL